MSLPINVASVAPAAKAPAESPRVQGAVDEGGGNSFRQELASRVDAREHGDEAGDAAAEGQAQAKSAPNDGQGADAALLAMLGLAAAAQPVQPVVTPLAESPEPEGVAEATPAELMAPAAVVMTAGQSLGATFSPLDVRSAAVKDASSRELPTLIAPGAAGYGGGALNAEVAATANFAAGLDEDLPGNALPAGEAAGFAELLVSTRLSPKGETAGAVHTAAAKPAEMSHLAEPVGSKGWGDALAQRVGMMLGRKEQQIDMQLNPPHLGPMEVKLTLGNEQASVVFTSQHAAVREALAAASPRLTALLADQGIQLTDVQVASDSLQQHQQQAAQQQAQSNQGGEPRSASAFAERDGVAGNHSRAVIGELRVPIARSGVSFYA